MNTYTFKKFKRSPLLKNIVKASGSYLYDKNNKYFDLTSGYPNITILGYNNSKVNFSIKRQMNKFTHLNPNICDFNLKENLSKNLILNSHKKTNKVYFSGTSGSDSIEAAIKMSIQYHRALGYKKKYKIISRKDSYHGSTYETLSLSDTPFFDIYKQKYSSSKYIKINSHNPINRKKKNITINDYTKNSIKELENAILFHGAENITAFVGETIMGNFSGNIEPSKKYWSSIHKICKKNKINLILDEIYCGMGRSGEIYSFNKYSIDPEFVCLSKSLTNGTIPFSVVLSKSSIEKVIIKKFGRVFHGHTFQANALGVAAANTVMSIINKKSFLNAVNKKSHKLKKGLLYLKENFSLFENCYGVGLMQTLKFEKNINQDLVLKIQNDMLYKNKYLMDTRFNRISFTPNLNITNKEIDKFINSFEIYLRKKL